METGPSPIAESLVAALLPAGRREDVMGDLHQRYANRFGYWKDVVSVVPAVVVSHFRRESIRRAERLSRRTVNGWCVAKTLVLGRLVQVASIVGTLSLVAWFAVRAQRWSLLAAVISSCAAAVWQASAAAERVALNVSRPTRTDAGE